MDDGGPRPDSQSSWRHARAGGRAQIWLPAAARVPTGRPTAKWWRGTGTGEGEGEESSGRRVVALHGHQRRLGFPSDRGGGFGQPDGAQL